MNEVIINKSQIESIWEKDNLCFVRMKSGKVWLCEKQIKMRMNELCEALGTGRNYAEEQMGVVETAMFISNAKIELLKLPLSVKEK